MQTSQGASQSPCNGTHCKSEPDCHGHTWQSRNITGLQTSAPRHSSCCSSAGASSPRNLRGKKLSGWASVPIQAKRWLWPGGFVGGCPCSQGMAVLSLLLVCCSWGTSWQLSLTSAVERQSYQREAISPCCSWCRARCCLQEGRSNANNLLSCCKDATRRPVNGHIKGIRVGAGNTLTNTILP